MSGYGMRKSCRVLPGLLAIVIGVVLTGCTDEGSGELRNAVGVDAKKEVTIADYDSSGGLQWWSLSAVDPTAVERLIKSIEDDGATKTERGAVTFLDWYPRWWNGGYLQELECYSLSEKNPRVRVWVDKEENRIFVEQAS